MTISDKHITAFHEAGHAVAAMKLGVRLSAIWLEECIYSIETGEGSSGGMNFARAEADPAPEHLEGLVQVYFAGYAAEVRVSSDQKTRIRLGARNDDEKAAEVLRTLGKRAGPFRRKAAALVADNWAAIEVVANELVRADGLDRTEVEFLIRLAEDEPGSAADLIRYRSLVEEVKGDGFDPDYPLGVLLFRDP